MWYFSTSLGNIFKIFFCIRRFEIIVISYLLCKLTIWFTRKKRTCNGTDVTTAIISRFDWIFFTNPSQKQLKKYSPKKVQIKNHAIFFLKSQITMSQQYFLVVSCLRKTTNVHKTIFSYPISWCLKIWSWWKISWKNIKVSLL